MKAQEEMFEKVGRLTFPRCPSSHCFSDSFVRSVLPEAGPNFGSRNMGRLLP